MASDIDVTSGSDAPVRRVTLKPLVVDLDGTLIRTDLLVESFLTLLSQRPFEAIGALGLLKNGKAAFKSGLADKVLVATHLLPINEAVFAFVTNQRDLGRKIYLATASDRRYAEALAQHLGVFDGVLGSENGHNLAGDAKAERLVAMFGDGGFDYIGDAAVDEAVWRRADGVYVADGAGSLMRRVKGFAPHATAIGTPTASLKQYVKAMRVHQWLKNLLILLPALAAHEFNAPLLQSIVAFFAFSFCASSVYIVNDLLDLESDRAHARKKKRPFAAGSIPIVRGAMLIPVLLLGALALALFLPVKFLVVLAGYYALTCAYSFSLKRRALIDVVTLACLYGTRLLAGAAAADVPVSAWLAAFAIFIFMCLALVKRCAELVDRINAGKSDPPGRDYRLSDLPILQAMSIASGYVAILVLALYFNSAVVVALYGHFNRLWLICVLLLFWVSRTILLTHRGEMHDDPVVFAATDRTSQVIGLACGVIALASL